MSLHLDELQAARGRLFNAPAQADMSEAELLAVVLEMSEILGWKRAHFRPAMTKHGWRTAVAGDGKGWPDLMLVRERLVAAELKGPRGRMSAEQKRWREQLERVGVEYHLWTPADWFVGTVENVLR